MVIFIKRLLVCYTLAMLVVACEPRSRGSEAVEAQSTFVDSEVEAVDTLPFTSKHICRAATNIMNGTDPGIIRMSEANGVIFATYNRKSDGKQWNYKCKFQGDRVVWGSLDGRWQDHPSDGKISFTVYPDEPELMLRVRYSDGSSTQRNYVFSYLDANM